ncbi:hypothetical protein [Leptospira sp. GIMC2001]|uniref:hypothetical protein n=1 Tax=Leptospira sp. GIMC2001 TaxID=1513297 RepID=UPI0023496E0D|nr:hypothetical protein [Leptospira sp. GIMC2001]WCL51464.1 hypothetical protein O4O04_20320 [Leptospira sp. GIMC2001]
MEEPQKENYSRIKKTIGIIIIGAFGSGIWDIVFKPSTSFLLSTFVKLAAETSSAYRNSLYIESARGFHEQSSVFLHLIAISIIPFLYLVILRRHPYKYSKEARTKNKKTDFLNSNKGYYLLLFITTLAFFSAFLSLVKVSYVNSTITYFQQSITILEPVYSVNEVKFLKAAFAGMRSAEDFKRIETELEKKAIKFKIKLPDLIPNIDF